jgi:hypothetical protein
MRHRKSHEMPDNRHLQKRRQTWYVRVAVPESLWKTIGKQHIVKSLQTRDVAEARQLRWAALSEIKSQLADAHRRLKGGIPPRAIDVAAWEISQRQWYQDVLKRCPENGTGPDDDNERDLADHVLHDIAEEVEEAHGLQRARQFHDFVTNPSAPISGTKTAWLKQTTGTITEQTSSQHGFAVDVLLKSDPTLVFVCDVRQLDDRRPNTNNSGRPLPTFLKSCSWVPRSGLARSGSPLSTERVGLDRRKGRS